MAEAAKLISVGVPVLNPLIILLVMEFGVFIIGLMDLENIYQKRQKFHCTIFIFNAILQDNLLALIPILRFLAW